MMLDQNTLRSFPKGGCNKVLKWHKLIIIIHDGIIVFNEQPITKEIIK